MTDRLLHWAADRARPHLHGAPRAQRRRQHRRLAPRHLRARRWTARARIGQALLDRGLSAERPVAILSENSLEHALLALGCLLRRRAALPGVARLLHWSARTTTSCATCWTR